MIPWLRARGFALVSTTVALAWMAPSLYAFSRVAWSRLNETYPLWWLEPLFYRSALASQQGLSLYPPPGLEHTPPIYNPGFPVVGGWVIALFGEGYPALRWFSFLCFVALTLVIAWWSARETRSPAVGVLAFGLAISLQAPMGRWITAINVDTPSIALGFVGLWLVTRERLTRAGAIAAGLLITVGFAFKQPACLLALPALTHLVWTDRKAALWFALACGGSALVMLLWLGLGSDGWYWTYAFDVPLRTEQRDTPFVRHFVAEHWLPAIASVIAPIVLTAFAPERLRGLWLPLSLATLAMAYAGFRKDGGDMNTLLPAYVTGVLCWSMLPGVMLPPWSPQARSTLRTLAIAVVLIGGGYATHARMTWMRNRAATLELEARSGNPSTRTYPKHAEFEARLRRTIATLPKPVFVGARFFGMQGPLNAHQSALYEGTSRTQGFDLGTQIEPTLRRHHYKALILWSYWNNDAFDRVVERHYVKDAALGPDPVIGLHVHVWLPKRARAERRTRITTGR